MDNKNELSQFIIEMRKFKNSAENIGKDGTTLFNDFKVFEKVKDRFEYYDRAEAVRKAILEFCPDFDSVHLEGMLKDLEISESQWNNIFDALNQSQSHHSRTEDTDYSIDDSSNDDGDDDNLPPSAPIPSPVS